MTTPRSLTTALALLAAAWLLSAVPAAAQAPAPAAPSLYERLGRYDAIAAVTDDFLGRLAADPSLAKFFAGHSTDSLQRARQLIVDQLCAATGGPCIYLGRSMKTVHAGMGISPADWDTTVKHLVATLDKFKVPAQEKGEVLAAISSMRDDIVETPAAK